MASFLKARTAPATTGGEVVQAPPPIETWAPGLRAAVAQALDAEPTGDPEALPHGFGPWAFRLALGPDRPGATVRLATDRAELDREVAAMALSAAHGLATPEVRSIVEVEGGDDDGAVRWALVADEVTDIALPELIGFNLHHANDLLDGFAAHHLALHQLPIDPLAGPDGGAVGAVPAVSARDELDRIDRSRYPGEWAWLDDHVPSPAPPALAHGGYQPLAVFGPPPERWPELGGPGHGLTVVNWCGAVLAEPAYDVAFTLVAFWSAPFFAPNRSERTAIKMIRNTLLNTYKQGYTSRAAVDPDRLKFWQALHALRGLARLEGAYDADGSPFAAPDRGAVPVELGPELHRHVRQLTRVR